MGIHAIRMPDIGEGIAEAEIAEWLVKPGDTLREDDPMVAVMTDKATVEITSPINGVVVALHGEAGQQVPVGGPLVSFKVEGKGNVAEAPAAAPTPAAKAEKAASAPVAEAKRSRLPFSAS